MQRRTGLGDRSIGVPDGPDAPIATGQGINTLSMTWITPFDCMTSLMVTIDMPLLASVSISLPMCIVAVSGSPCTVVSVAVP